MGIESLFDYEGWDSDSYNTIFFSPTLKVQVDKYPPGTQFSCAEVRFIDGTLEFFNFNEKYQENESMGQYSLVFSVGH